MMYAMVNVHILPLLPALRPGNGALGAARRAPLRSQRPPVTTGYPGGPLLEQ
jgi:hypothetical protein